MHLLRNEHQSCILVEKKGGNQSQILLFQVRIAKSNSSRVPPNRLRKLAAFDARKFGQWFADHRCHAFGCPLVTVFHNSQWPPSHRALPTSNPNSITLNQILWFKRRSGQWNPPHANIILLPVPVGRRNAKIYIQSKVVYEWNKPLWPGIYFICKIFCYYIRLFPVH